MCLFSLEISLCPRKKSCEFGVCVCVCFVYFFFTENENSFYKCENDDISHYQYFTKWSQTNTYDNSVYKYVITDPTSGVILSQTPPRSGHQERAFDSQFLLHGLYS